MVSPADTTWTTCAGSTARSSARCTRGRGSEGPRREQLRVRGEHARRRASAGGDAGGAGRARPELAARQLSADPLPPPAGAWHHEPHPMQLRHLDRPEDADAILDLAW